VDVNTAIDVEMIVCIFVTVLTKVIRLVASCDVGFGGRLQDLLFFFKKRKRQV
jgi:hypothetical protein